MGRRSIILDVKTEMILCMPTGVILAVFQQNGMDNSESKINMILSVNPEKINTTFALLIKNVVFKRISHN